MGNARDYLSETRPQPGGVVRDLKRLKSDGAATVAELREFIGQMRGKSPQEMLGLVANSGLAWSIVLATLLFVALLVAGTVIPYALKDRTNDAAKPATGPTMVAEDGAPQPDDAQPAETAPAETSVDTAGGEMDAEKAIKALGIDETRTADPEKNPLEDKLDKLLDGVE
jgi:hypothetical protein